MESLSCVLLSIWDTVAAPKVYASPNVAIVERRDQEIVFFFHELFIFLGNGP